MKKGWIQALPDICFKDMSFMGVVMVSEVRLPLGSTAALGIFIKFNFDLVHTFTYSDLFPYLFLLLVYFSYSYSNFVQ